MGLPLPNYVVQLLPYSLTLLLLTLHGALGWGAGKAPAALGTAERPRW